MLIDNKITRKIANLAKIELTEQELIDYSNDLSNILKWMEELKKVDVENISPLTSVNQSTLIEREDKTFEPIIEKQQLLLNAPSKSDEYFTVPKVIE